MSEIIRCPSSEELRAREREKDNQAMANSLVQFSHQINSQIINGGHRSIEFLEYDIHNFDQRQHIRLAEEKG